MKKFRSSAALAAALIGSLAFVSPVAAAMVQLQGSVVLQSGSGIAGATVTASGVTTESTVTNAAGAYSLSIDEGTYSVTVTPPVSSGFGPSTRSVVVGPSGAQLDFVYTPAGAPIVTVSGIVRDASGNPVAGIGVAASSAEGGGSAISAADGSYSFQTPAGLSYVSVSNFPPDAGRCNFRPMDCNFTYPGFNLNTGGRTFDINTNRTLDLTLPPLGMHTFHVTSASGSPLQGVPVTPNGGSPITLSISGTVAAGLDLTGNQQLRSGVTDANGNLVFQAFATSTSSMWTALPPVGYQAASAETTFAPDGTTEFTLPDAPVITTVTISGTLRDTNGQAVPGITITTLNPNGNGFAATGSDGSYSLTIPAGPTRLRIYNYPRDSAYCEYFPTSCNASYPTFLLDTNGPTLDVAAGTIDLTIPALGARTFHVTDTSGAVLADAVVVPQSGSPLTLPISFEARPGLSMTGTQDVRTVLTNSNGDAVVRALPSQPTIWAISRNGYLPTSATVTLGVDETTSVVLTAAPLVQNVVFTGVLRDGSGAPVPGIQIGTIGQSTNGGTYTAADGSFRIETPAGFVRLTMYNYPRGAAYCDFFPAGCNSSYPSFSLDTGTASLDLSTSRSLDLTIPSLARHTFTTLTTGSTPLPSVGVFIVGGPVQLPLSTTVAPGLTLNGLQELTGGPLSDAAGNAVVRFLPTNQATTWNIAPPTGYRATSITKVLADGGTTVLIIPSTIVSNDGDNVVDTIEAGAPNNGDGNADGTPDNQQANVTSLPAVGGQYLTLAAPTSTALATVSVVDPASYTAPPQLTLPFGLVDFTLENTAVGQDVVLTIYADTTGVTGYAKYRNGTWTTLPANRVTIFPNRVEIRLTDGGVGDDDGTANGTVVDPGGLVIQRTPPNTAPVVAADMGVSGLQEIGFQTGIVAITGTFTDAQNNGPFTASVRWQTGGAFTPLIITNNGRFTAAWIYLTPTIRTATVRICDAAGACGTDDITIRPMVTTKITPIAQCVTDRGPSTTPRFAAKWGYINPASYPIAVPIIGGVENTFTSTPFDRGQPQILKPGRNLNVFTTTFQTGTQSWKLNGTTTTAKTSTTRC